MDEQVLAQIQAIQFVIVTVLFGIPVYKILGRTGKSRWWVVSLLLPVLGTAVALWVIAFGRWTKDGSGIQPS